MDDTWSIWEDCCSEENLANRESLYSVGNGYLGFRGFFTERKPAYHPGVFINGFYELTPILYGEHAYGLAKYNQTMLDLPDCRYLDIMVGDEQFSMSEGKVSRYRRELNFRTGILTRQVSWESPQGRKAEMTWETLISLEYRHLGALRFTICTKEGVHARIRSTIALPSERPLDEYDPRVSTALMRPPLEQTGSSYEKLNGTYSIFSSFRTIESDLSLTLGVHHVYDTGIKTALEQSRFSLPFVTFYLDAQPFTLIKYFYYHAAQSPGASVSEDEVEKSKRLARTVGWEKLKEKQKHRLDEFWKCSNAEIKGDELLQRSIRFNLFQLYQSAGKDGRTSLAAKGLSGGGYEGHYFWDTEIYGMPFFTFTNPGIAAALIRYRISILGNARLRAEEMDQKGALFPWRTINGMEASAYYPAGTAQYHINGDIAYSIFQYMDVTGDYEILFEGGAQLLFETARLWADLGFFNPRKGGAFCINEVTGPDEYSALVNNNLYTNAIARYHLRRTAELAQIIQGKYPCLWDELQEQMGITDAETDQWKRAAELMYLGYDREEGIHPQDDSFLDREPWDFSGRPESKYPLLLYYHPLVIYRYRVIKQADTVLAMLLLHDEFPWYQRKRNFDFYEPLTTGDSSLSSCIEGIVAFDCGREDLGLAFCRETSLMDIEDLRNNTKDGLHTAAMAGSWMGIVYGAAGFRFMDGHPSFRPRLPVQWDSLKFSIKISGRHLEVSMNSRETTYSLAGEPTVLRHWSEQIPLSKTVTVPTKAQCRAVVFDLDGVITSTDQYHYRAWKELADTCGWAFSPEANSRLRGVSRRESLEIILADNNIKPAEDELQRMLEKKNRRYQELLENLSPADILPGIRELLQELAEHNILTAVASASRNAGRILRKLDLKGTFQYVVRAEDVIIGKPDPEIFARAAEGLGLCNEECAGIEDAQAGIAALKAACMKAVGVGEAAAHCGADLHVDTPAELRAEKILSLF